MANIHIKDLDMNKELDKKAMENILGGWQTFSSEQILNEYKASSIGVGTFMNADGQIVQRYQDVYFRIVRGVTNPYDKSYIGAISTWPVPGSGP